MAILASNSDLDRHLSLRNGCYQYKRRVPAIVGLLDSRFPTVRIALGTRDVSEARVKRDAYERADHELWIALCGEGDQPTAVAHYQAAVSRAKTLGFTYRHISSILADESGMAVLERLRALQGAKPGSPEETAMLGGVARPRVSLWQAFDIYVNKIVASALSSKSAEQRKLWMNSKIRALKNFEAVCGPRNIGEITREDARCFYDWWLEKIAPDSESKKAPTHKPDSGNKELGVLRGLFRDYWKHEGEEDLKNPFRNLQFHDKYEWHRPPFPTDWIVGRLLAVGALRTLNREARAIFLGMIETGCRPSEIANLPPECIVLDHQVPHIKVRPRMDPDNPREVKSRSSIRDIPLVGVSLAAIKEFPNGFPTYRDNGNGLSAVLGKYLEENGLLPTDEHAPYSLRHSFEDRAKEALLDTEMRMILMGHKIDRPKYGDGGSLAWKRDGLLKMVLPFDPSIV
ncbi:integrase [Rhizobium ruizarguesonis]